MRGKTIVITGATSGIGEVAAIRLAEQGARIVFTARDQARADVTMEKLRRANGAAEHAMHLADLSLLADMKRVAGEIGAGTADRCPDQQCGGAVQRPPGNARRAGEDLRPQSHVLFRDHQSACCRS